MGYDNHGGRGGVAYSDHYHQHIHRGHYHHHPVQATHQNCPPEGNQDEQP